MIPHYRHHRKWYSSWNCSFALAYWKSTDRCHRLDFANVVHWYLLSDQHLDICRHPFSYDGHILPIRIFEWHRIDTWKCDLNNWYVIIIRIPTWKIEITYHEGITFLMGMLSFGFFLVNTNWHGSHEKQYGKSLESDPPSSSVSDAETITGASTSSEACIWKIIKCWSSGHLSRLLEPQSHFTLRIRMDPRVELSKI